MRKLLMSCSNFLPRLNLETVCLAVDSKFPIIHPTERGKANGRGRGGHLFCLSSLRAERNASLAAVMAGRPELGPPWADSSVS